METVLSPLSHQPAEFVEALDTQTIIRLYKEAKLEVAHYFTGLDHISIYHCPASGYRFYHPFHLAGKGDLYEQIQRNSATYYPIRWEHHQALKAIHNGDHVLDVGCGDGGFLQFAGKHRKDLSLHGTEFNTMAVNLGISRGLNIVQDSIENYSATHAGQFDVVTAFQVLEHVTDVLPFLEAATRCLKKGGRLVIGVPNNHPYIYKTDKYHTLNLPPHHMGLWNRESLSSLENYIDVKNNTIALEPLVNYRYYTDLYIRNAPAGKRMLLKALRPFVRLFFRFTKNSRTGQCILAIYEKK